MHFRLSQFMLSAVLLVSAVQAHFRMQYPIPRGPFVADLEPTFCDGYTNVTPNRTTYPLTGGPLQFTTGHPMWTFGAFISTKQNSTSFADFNDPANSSQPQYVLPLFQSSGEKTICLNLPDLTKSNISGIAEGSNVTIQFLFNGGDGNLYQCADLTLSRNATVPAFATSECTVNATSTEGSSVSSTAPASISTGSSSGSKSDVQISEGLLLVAGFVAVALSV